MTRYGKIDPNDNSRVIYAANGGVYNGRLYPTFPDAVQRALGNLPVAPDTPPSDPAPEGYHYEARNYAVDGSEIRRQYEAVQDAPPPPRTFSKLKIVAALTSAGVWAQAKAYIEQAELYDLYLAAQDFREDNQFFAQGRAALQSALGMTDAQVEAILAASVTDY